MLEQLRELVELRFDGLGLGWNRRGFCLGALLGELSIEFDLVDELPEELDILLLARVLLLVLLFDFGVVGATALLSVVEG